MPSIFDTFQAQIGKRGWYLFDQVIAAPLVASLTAGLEVGLRESRKVITQKGLKNADGAAHHLLGSDPVFMEFLQTGPLFEVMRDFLQGNFILNSFGGVWNERNAKSYLLNVHRDVKNFTGDYKLMINMMILLDDFTEANGATYLLSGSHLQPEKPDDAFFFANAERACGRKGSVVLFDSNLWHSAGRNETDFPRRALTLTFTRPFIKPQFDYLRAFGEAKVATFSETLKQILGYYSRVPASLAEWYAPPEERFYRADQN